MTLSIKAFITEQIVSDVLFLNDFVSGVQLDKTLGVSDFSLIQVLNLMKLGENAYTYCLLRDRVVLVR